MCSSGHCEIYEYIGIIGHILMLCFRMENTFENYFSYIEKSRVGNFTLEQRK